jgi:alpha-amylase
MIKWRRAAAGQGFSNWQTNGGDNAAFGRGAKAFVAINLNGGSSWGTTLQTGLPKGSYCNVIIAGCTQKIDVGSDGKAQLTVPSLGAVAFHV